MTDKFNGGDYLENRLEYYIECEGEDIRAFIKENRKKTLNELLKVLKLHKARDIKGYDKEGLNAHKMEIEIIQIMIAAALNVPTVGGIWYLVDSIEEFRQAFMNSEKARIELEAAFRNHRHDKHREYSEKPVW